MLKNPFKFHAKVKKINTKRTQSENSRSLRKLNINLTELENGNMAKVLNIQGGRSLAGRLGSMGIIPGAIIIKKSAFHSRGPIIVEIGTIQFALGYGMAKNIIVEPIKQEI